MIKLNNIEGQLSLIDIFNSEISYLRSLWSSLLNAPVVFNTKVLTYPDGSQTIQHMSSQFLAGKPVANNTVRKKDRSDKDADECAQKSISRSKTTVYGIARSNIWTHFVTLTLDKDKVSSRYDYEEATRVLRLFTKRLQRRGISWLIVPEFHKDKAYHFHALVNIPEKVDLKFYSDTVYSNKSKKNFTRNRSDIWEFGANDWQPVKDAARASRYVLKYITKDMKEVVPEGRKRYWASLGLARPIVSRVEVSSGELINKLAGGEVVSPYLEPLEVHDHEVIDVMLRSYCQNPEISCEYAVNYLKYYTSDYIKHIYILESGDIIFPIDDDVILQKHSELHSISEQISKKIKNRY